MILTIASAIGLSVLSNPFMEGSIEDISLYSYSDELPLLVEQPAADTGAFLPDCRSALCGLMRDSEPMDPFLVLVPLGDDAGPAMPMSTVLRPAPALQLGMRP